MLKSDDAVTLDSATSARLSSVSNMRRASIFPLVVLLVAQFSTVAAQLDIPSNEYLNRANEALQQLFPQNILKRYPDLKIDDTIPANATKCSEQVELLVDGLMNGTIWALKMIDASSKIPSGILMGNRMDLGMYDECVAIRAEIEAGEEIRGRHCMYSVAVDMGAMELSESLSICLPAACEPEEIEIILNQFLETIQLMIGFEIPVNIKGVSCTSVETLEWTAGGITTLVGFSLLLLFLAVSTICDALLRCSKGNFSSNSKLALIGQFSVYSSALRILSTKATPQTLPALQGLRFFSMCWVILGHEYILSIAAPSINPLDMIVWTRSWDSLYIMIAPFAVDTFFTISGFLISYIFLKEMSSGRRFNIFAYYIHRYLRLTPALAAMILLTIFIFPRIGSGALWQQITETLSNSCRNNWWPMLLYVHNYVNKKDLMCLAHTWYLAVEMQFFVFSPFILYPLSKKPKIGLGILGILFIASVVTPAKISYDNEYSSGFAFNDIANTLETVSNFYMETHIRAAAWLIGIFFGYLVFTQKGSTRKVLKWIGWLSATAAFLFCIFSFRKYQAENYTYEPVWDTFYAAVARPLWSFGVAWVIYASVRGFGGPVTTILSFSIFNPFSRISYCIYLVHFVVQMLKIGAVRVPRYLADFSLFNLFLSDFILSVFLGFVCCLLFESPILILEKIVTKRNRRNTDESKRELKEERVENGTEDNPALTAR